MIVTSVRLLNMTTQKSYGRISTILFGSLADYTETN